MKSLIIAFVFFGVVILGCWDVQPFKAVKRVLRRTPSKTGRLQQTAPLPQEPPQPTYQDYPVRRRHYQ
jgi:hypothetical protein